MTKKNINLQKIVNNIVKKERKKYNKDVVLRLLTALAEGQGRVRACKMAGIFYETFTEWLDNKPEFVDAVKKAEEIGDDKIADICKRRIIEDGSWQSAAWWLERNYPDQYALRSKMEHTIQVPKIVVEDEEQADKIKKLEGK
jgi:hypothetical protein